MKCPCGGSLIVKDGRLVADGYWRRRRCVACSTEYTTLEQFCETVRGTRLRQPTVEKPKVPKVTATRSLIKPETVIPPKRAYTPRKPKPREQSVRSKIEDMKMEKELETLSDHW